MAYPLVAGAGKVAALFTDYNVSPVTGEMVSPGQLQRAKEDLVINVGAVGVGAVESGAVTLARQQGQAMLRSAGESFGPQIGGMFECTVPALRLNVVEDGLAGADLVRQSGGLTSSRFPRSEGLGTHATIDELRATSALPGEQGVIVTDPAVRFGDVYELATLGGRQVEFSLVTERVDGALVKKLYSGDAWTSPVPRDVRLVGGDPHTLSGREPGLLDPSSCKLHPWIKWWFGAASPVALCALRLLDGDEPFRDGWS
nr:hypothetical protein [Paraburkholderia sp. J10-1]